jgi:enoyl-CoA hydratase
MELNNCLLEKHDGIATITINRPKALNALNRDTLTELDYLIAQLGADRQIKVVVLTGAGEKSFVAGADISYMQSFSAGQAREFGQLGHKVMNGLETMMQPVIAAINGFALGGGCELALACDIRYAAENAKFGQPEVNLGVIPGFGGTQRLPRIVGAGLASELLFSGEIIDAAEALRIGLVNKVLPADKLLGETYRLAGTIASRGPGAVRMCKEAIKNGLECDLRRACSYEADLFALCFSTKEQKEGMQAFLEKRNADFGDE